MKNLLTALFSAPNFSTTRLVFFSLRDVVRLNFFFLFCSRVMQCQRATFCAVRGATSGLAYRAATGTRGGHRLWDRGRTQFAQFLSISFPYIFRIKNFLHCHCSFFLFLSSSVCVSSAATASECRLTAKVIAAKTGGDGKKC